MTIAYPSKSLIDIFRNILCGKYTIRDIAKDEEFEKTKAMLRLMCELNEGRRSGEEEGYKSLDDVRKHFKDKAQ